MLHLDRFIIRKGDGVYDMWDFINAAMQGNDYQSTLNLLADSHHELDHTFTGVEGDAAHEALRKGLADEQTARIYFEGPQGPNDNQYVMAFRKMVLAGAPVINEAVEEQNKMNIARGWKRMNLPFQQSSSHEYTVDGQWHHKELVVPKNQLKQTDGSITPWDPLTGQLVTGIISQKTGRKEAFLRPYAEALEKKRGLSGPQDRKKTNDEIHPALIHRNAIYLKDPTAGLHIYKVIKEAQAAAQHTGMDPAQAAHQALMANKVFRKITGGIHHRSFEETYGRYSDAAMQQYGEQMPDYVSEIQPNEDMMKPGFDDLKTFLHPDLHEKPWFRQMNNSSHYRTGPGMQAGIKDLMDSHGATEEEARAWYAAANDKTKGGNTRERFLNALVQFEMKDGVPPKWAAEGGWKPEAAQPLTGGQPQPQTQPQPAPAAADPLRPQGGGMGMAHPAVVSAPPHMQAPPAAPPPMGAQAVASPPPHMQVAAPPNPIGAYNNIGSVPPAPNRAGFMENLGEKLGRLYGRTFPGGFFGKEDTEKSQIENLLEQVQIDIAKNEISEPNRIMKSDSPIDVSIVAGEMNKASSDIIGIIFSRGDWRNIAKSFGVQHTDVQQIKVMFNE